MAAQAIGKGHYDAHAKKMAAKPDHWIGAAVKRPGALHAKLGVPMADKIPAKKLNAAADKSGLLGKEARFAKVLKGFKK